MRGFDLGSCLCPREEKGAQPAVIKHGLSGVDVQSEALSGGKVTRDLDPPQVLCGLHGTLRNQLSQGICFQTLTNICANIGSLQRKIFTRTMTNGLEGKVL